MKSDYKMECVDGMYLCVIPIAPTLNSKFVSSTYQVSPEFQRFKDSIESLWSKYYRSIKPILKLMKGKKFIDKNVKMRIEIHEADNRRDIDATEKVIQDSLQGKFYENDSQIWDKHTKQFLKKEDPFVVVSVWESKRYKE